MIFLILFSTILSGTYNYVESSYADALMKKGDCNKASTAYYNDYLKSKNPLVASNYALSLLCLNRIKEAESIFDLAYLKIDGIEDKISREELKLNYSYIKSLSLKFDESNVLLALVNETLLSNTARSLYLALLCKNNIYLNNYYTALNYCVAAYNTDKDSCFKASLLAKLYYYLERYDSAVRIYEKIFDRCVCEDSSYSYSLSLYRLDKKELAMKILEKDINSKKNKDLYDLIKKM